MQRIKALTVKEWREILRDRVYLSLAFAVPLMWMIVFGYGLSFDVENVPFMIMDYDRSAMSRDYCHRYIDSRYFDFRGYLGNMGEASDLLADSRIRLVIVIPGHFERYLMEGRPASIQTIIDGTFPSRTQTLQGYIEAINSAANAELIARSLADRYGIPPDRAELLVQPLRIEMRYLYNQSLRSVWSIAPSLIMFALMLAPPLLTALSVVREKEYGSIYNIYASTITRWEFIAGKLLPNLMISSINGLVLWFMAAFYFGTPFKGSFILFCAATFLFILTTSSIGLLISFLVRTQVAALLITVVLSIIPTILYSGMLLPVSSLTDAGIVQAHMFPTMYYHTIVRGVFLKGIGIGVLWFEMVALCCFAVVLISLCAMLFRKRPST